MRYEILRGDPMSRRGCMIVELNGSDPMGWYVGFYDEGKREWNLYPHKQAERHHAPMKKKTVSERDVHFASKSPEVKKKKTKTTKGSAQADDGQIRLV